jgi:hypothetical protein
LAQQGHAGAGAAADRVSGCSVMFVLLIARQESCMVYVIQLLLRVLLIVCLACQDTHACVARFTCLQLSCRVIQANGFDTPTVLDSPPPAAAAAAAAGNVPGPSISSRGGSSADLQLRVLVARKSSDWTAGAAEADTPAVEMRPDNVATWFSKVNCALHAYCSAECTAVHVRPTVHSGCHIYSTVLSKLLAGDGNAVIGSLPPSAVATLCAACTLAAWLDRPC